MTTLYLTADEQARFDALDNAVKEGWTTEKDIIAYEETDRRRQARLRTMNIQDPWLKEFQEKAKKMRSPEDIVQMMEGMDLTKLNNSDLAELLYALGPNILSALLQKILNKQQDDEGMELAAALSSMRHLLFAKR